MRPNEWASVISAVIAALSLALNFYLVRNVRPKVAKKEDVRQAIRDMLNVLQSRLLTVPEFEEVWGQGFRSLANIVSVVGQSKTTIDASPANIVPQIIRRDVADLHNAVSGLYDLQDSWYHFTKNQDYVADAAPWKDFGMATRRLKALQDTYNRTRDRLSDYLEKLSD